MTARRAVLALVATPALLCAAEAGVVRTAARRMEGPVCLAADHVAAGAGGERVPWAEVVSVVLNADVRPLGSPGAVRLKSGEVWFCEVLGLSVGKLRARIDPVGTHPIDAVELSVLEFAAGLPRDDDLKDRTLYRRGQRPVPGALLWLDGDRIAIDSPFGPLTLQREGTERYVFARPVPLPPLAADDEVTLVNGTVLRGRLSGAAGAVLLVHALLGKVTVPAAAIRSVVRPRESAVFLTELSPRSAKTISLVGRADRAPAIAHCSPNDELSRRLGAARALRIEPPTTVEYSLAGRAGKAVRLTAVVAPLPGARAAARVRISASGEVVAERLVAPKAEPAPVDAALPAGGALRIEVDFGDRPTMPCGVVLADPLLVSAEAPQRRAGLDNGGGPRGPGAAGTD